MLSWHHRLCEARRSNRKQNTCSVHIYTHINNCQSPPEPFMCTALATLHSSAYMQVRKNMMI